MQILLVSNIIFIIFPIYFKIYRALHEGNSHLKVHAYSANTATSSLRSHLLRNHMTEWVTECQRLNIPLKGKEGEEAFAKFTGQPLQRQAEVRTPFSQDSFLDGLVQFIIATNQVCVVF